MRKAPELSGANGRCDACGERLPPFNRNNAAVCPSCSLPHFAEQRKGFGLGDDEVRRFELQQASGGFADAVGKDDQMDRCDACGAPVNGSGRYQPTVRAAAVPSDNLDSHHVGRLQQQEDDDARATSLDREAKQLMAADSRHNYGSAIRTINNKREREAQLAADAIRYGASEAHVQHARELSSRAERLQQREGITFSDAMKQVLRDPTPAMRRLREALERGGD
jgi:hypothetical protein